MLLVYGIIALIVIGLTSEMTVPYVQSFDTMNSLKITVYNVSFLGNGSSSNPLRAAINWSLSNPTDYGALRLNTVWYSVFLNSTTEQFSPGDSSQFSLRAYTFGTLIAGHSNLNVTYAVQADGDVTYLARLFLGNHTGIDLTPIVGVNLVIVTSFGPLSIPSCFQMPGGQRTTCPPTRVPLRGRFG